MLQQEVNLVGVRIFAGHGYYSEEQSVGNEFIIDVFTRFSITENSDANDLKNTLNYEILYQIIKNETTCTVQLLEALAQQILEEIKNQFSYLEHITVKVKKIQPPMGGEMAYSEVVRIFNS